MSLEFVKGEDLAYSVNQQQQNSSGYNSQGEKAPEEQKSGYG